MLCDAWKKVEIQLIWWIPLLIVRYKRHMEQEYYEQIVEENLLASLDPMLNSQVIG